jgi:hypothetical protein
VDGRVSVQMEVVEYTLLEEDSAAGAKRKLEHVGGDEMET